MKRPKLTAHDRRLRELERENKRQGEALETARQDILALTTKLSQAEKIRQDIAKRYNCRGTQVLAAAAIIRQFAGQVIRNDSGAEVTVPLRVVAELITSGEI